MLTWSRLFLACAERAPEPDLTFPLPDAPETGGDSAVTTSPAPDPPPCAATGVEVGDCAPDFALTASDGQLVSLSEWRGELVIVHSAALW